MKINQIIALMLSGVLFSSCAFVGCGSSEKKLSDSSSISTSEEHETEESSSSDESKTEKTTSEEKAETATSATEKTTQITTEKATEVTTEKATEEVTETHNSIPEKIEENEVFEIAQKAVDALNKGDYDGIYRYTDFGLFYDLDNTEGTNFEDFCGEFGDLFGEDELKINLVSVEKSDSELNSYNSFIQTLKENLENEPESAEFYDNLKIEAAYIVKTENDSENDNYVCMLKINGEWRLGFVLALTKAFTQAFS